jgi:hypothetical protein
MAHKDEIIEQIKKEGMDVGVTDSGGGTVISPDHNNGGISFEQSDVSVKTKKTLADYLKVITQTNNIYHINSDDKLDKTFVEESQFKGEQPTYFDSKGELKDISSISITPITVDKKLVTGHNLLTDGLKIVEQFVAPKLESNRYNIDNQHVGEFTKPIDKNFDISYENKTRKDELKVVNKELTVEKLGKIGRTLMLRSSGKVTSNNSDFDPDNITNSSLSVVPGTAQLTPSQNINLQDLSVKNIIKSLTGEDVGESFNESDLKSWGNLNNYNEPFDGITSVGMNALSVALLLAVDASIRILDQLLNIFVDKPKFPYTSDGIHFKGHFRSSNEHKDFKNVHSLLGLKETSYSYFESLDKGIKIFFGDKGTDIGKNIRSNLVNSFEKTKDSPGFYIILCRAILRSGYGVGNKISEISSDNPLSFIQSSLSIIKDLNRSKIISACNMFAIIGDTAFREEDFIASNINEQNINNDASSQYKIRHNKSKTLKYRNSSAPSLYILPKNYLNFASLNHSLDQTKTLLWDSSATYHENGSKEEIASSNVYKTENNKIPAEFVKRFEDYLEAEYVPFYFQDTRTNEIISFHAFLNNLTEDYSPQWDSIDNVFGRVDAIKIYKSTQRKLSVSFQVIAMDTNDFDGMWYKINKLITLVYPQWSKGKSLETIDKKINFTQPFSQIISSSPVIRLRIGDLIKSNYNKFALLRMFNTNNSKNEDKNSQKISLRVNRITKSINNLYSGNSSVVDYDVIQSSVNNRILKAVIKSNTVIIVNPTSELSETINTNVAKGKNIGANILGVNTNTNKVKNNRIVTTNTDLNVASIKSIKNNTVILDVKDSYFSKTYGTTTIGVPFNTCINLSFTNKWDSSYVKESLTNDANTNKDINEFINKENNSLIKFFEDNTFKGLSGVIDSLNFKWLDNGILWETSSPGSKAPMSCEITLGFSVIHDISPGIDYSGFNRAPVYNVGKQMNAVIGQDENNNTTEQSIDRLKK